MSTEGNPATPAAWRPCSNCKKPIGWGAKHWVCAVSTCNRPGTSFVFCSVRCWDAHVPVMNHRDPWCEERVAPARAPALSPRPPSPAAAPAAPAPAATAADDPRRRVVGRTGPPFPPPPAETDILIVASRLKDYIDRKSGMNTSAEVLEALSELVREATDAAIERAAADGRKTVKARDYRP